MQSADMVLPTTDGCEIRLRRIAEPTSEEALAYSPPLADGSNTQCVVGVPALSELTC